MSESRLRDGGAISSTGAATAGTFWHFWHQGSVIAHLFLRLTNRDIHIGSTDMSKKVASLGSYPRNPQVTNSVAEFPPVLIHPNLGNRPASP